MGWFDEQIRRRRQSDREAFEEGLADIAAAVQGKKRAARGDGEAQGDAAVLEILKYYRVKPGKAPRGLSDENERLEALLRPHGIMRRSVKLGEGWYRDAAGAMLAKRASDGAQVALIPRASGGYSLIGPGGEKRRVNARVARDLDAEAVAFYRPLPQGKLGIADLLRYISRTLVPADSLALLLTTLAATLAGLLLPRFDLALFGTVAESGSGRLLFAVVSFMACVSVSSLLLAAARALSVARIEMRVSSAVEAAAMMRVLSLPAGFFKRYSTGDLASRTASVRALGELLVSSLWASGLLSLFSLVYIAQIFVLAPSLAAPALAIVSATFAFSVATAALQARQSRRVMEESARESGLAYALISGVRKIKLAGAERRAFAKWSRLYARLARLEYDPPVFLRLNPAIGLAISLAGTLLIDYRAVQGGVSPAEYYAFSAAYGTVLGAFMQLAGVAMTAARIRPILHMVRPILEAEPETGEGRQIVEKLGGAVELSGVSFRYGEGMPNVLEGLSLKIPAGQYVAVVGRTGCGKSTLLRLLLGFETPQRGAVYYDGRDLNTLDLKSLRRKIGTVTQDGRLFSGDIYSNIVVAAPWLTQDDAWAAAETAGIAEDIRRMPMGMSTRIAEGDGGISGGQRQRLLIARAVAAKPKILLLDEATSALDNITQKAVSDSLAKLKCTRIVIAHRLSTIRACDRIVVLDGGRIVEDGTYDELTARGGAFADLVARQRLDAADGEKPPQGAQG